MVMCIMSLREEQPVCIYLKFEAFDAVVSQCSTR